MEMQNWSESILLVLTIVLLCFINTEESLGKSLLANSFDVENNEPNCIYSGSHPCSRLWAAALPVLVRGAVGRMILS